LTERYEKDTADLLQMSAPIILLARDKKAEYSLKMGFKFLARASRLRKYGFAIEKSILSSKIKFYIDAINNLVIAKRYAIFALVESNIPLKDKSDYKTQTFDEAMKNIENIEIGVYDYLRNELINNMNKKVLPETYPFLLHHDDNYNIIYNGKKSVLNEIGVTINSKVKNFDSGKDAGDAKTGTREPQNNGETPAGP
jgi:hypothetical protein